MFKKLIKTPAKERELPVGWKEKRRWGREFYYESRFELDGKCQIDDCDSDEYEYDKEEDEVEAINNN
jgi:hypothetical protein